VLTDGALPLVGVSRRLDTVTGDPRRRTTLWGCDSFGSAALAPAADRIQPNSS
jgi:hypothetical protein